MSELSLVGFNNNPLHCSQVSTQSSNRSVLTDDSEEPLTFSLTQLRSPSSAQPGKPLCILVYTQEDHITLKPLHIVLERAFLSQPHFPRILHCVASRRGNYSQELEVNGTMKQRIGQTTHELTRKLWGGNYAAENRIPHSDNRKSSCNMPGWFHVR